MNAKCSYCNARIGKGSKTTSFIINGIDYRLHNYCIKTFIEVKHPDLAKDHDFMKRLSSE